MAGKELRDIGIAPLTSEEMRAQRIIFIREMQLLLDMNFRDKYVVVEFTDGGKSQCCLQPHAENSINRVGNIIGNSESQHVQLYTSSIHWLYNYMLGILFTLA